MKSTTWLSAIAILLTTLAGVHLCGCSGSTFFLDHSFDFNYVERVAVIPFENLSQSQSAGKQATLILVTELLASETYAVIEPGETARVLNEIPATRVGVLDLDQIKDVGKKLNAQALVFGTVSETNTIRSGGVTVPTVTIDLRMVETETGGTVWAATRSEGRPSLMASLFGVGGKSSSETMQDCIHQLLKTLIK